MHAGLARTLLMPRFMDVLLQVPAPLRRLFLHAAIAAEDLLALRDFPLLGFSIDAPFVLIGHPTRCRVLRHLLARHGGVRREIREVTTSDEIDQLSILGAAAIAREGGYLKGVRSPWAAPIPSGGRRAADKRLAESPGEVGG
jgi:2-dehydro-3-deoxygalactonokinase